MIKHTIGRIIGRPVRLVGSYWGLLLAFLASGMAFLGLSIRWVNEKFALEVVSSLLVLGKLLLVLGCFGLTLLLAWAFLAGLMAAWNDKSH
jgi:hypothetical protein